MKVGRGNPSWKFPDRSWPYEKVVTGAAMLQTKSFMFKAQVHTEKSSSNNLRRTKRRNKTRKEALQKAQSSALKLFL